MLIIGYGNVLRGDDGAGYYAALALKRMGFDALAVHQLTPELAEHIAEAETVVFIDADAHLAPGGVRVSVAPYSPGESYDHRATPSGLLQLACDLYDSLPPAYIVGIGGESFDVSNRLSHAAARGVRKAIALLLRTASFEGIAGADVSGFQPPSEPADALLGRAVGK